ncbi:phosphatidylinositol 3 [Xylariaceae sp. FL0804]|nr:phosphatidylinositol 3 [Xylariaceae sp. FL0804]
MAPRSGARMLTLDKVLEALEGGNRATGSSGLENLIQIFRQQSKVSNLVKLDDKRYHRLFEAIFRYALSEKEAFYSARGSKSVASGRLARCAEALRLTVEHGASKIKRKTILALIDHITETLPHPEDDLVPPLLQDYLKALSALLSHAPNVEVLATHDGVGWISCIDFAVSVISHCVEDVDHDSTPSRASPAPGTGQTMSLTMSTIRSTASARRNNTGRMSRGYLSDTMMCLYQLVSAPNAPVLERSQQVASVILQVLQRSHMGMSQLHQLAFAALNILIVSTQTDDRDQSSLMAVDILPVILHWWQARTTSRDDALLNGVRTEILKMLYNVHLQLDFLVRQADEPSLIGDVESLCDLLWIEYSRRDERAQLQQDDLVYSFNYQPSNKLQVRAFALRPFNVEGERQWAVVHILALLEGILWKRSQHNQTSHVEDEQPRKKQRTVTGFSRIRQKLRTVDKSLQHMALQMIPFLISDIDITADTTSELLSYLTGLVTNKNSKLSNWAVIACASLASKTTARDGSLDVLWKQAWQVAVRLVSMTATCRASSALLRAIIINGLLPFREISDDINSIVTTADVNGPAVLVDSSIILMTTLLRLRNQHLPSASHATCNHVIRWMLLRWDPMDTNFISSNASHVSPSDVVNLIRAAYGDNELCLSGASRTIHGPIAETLFLLQEREAMVRYLLLLDKQDWRSAELAHEKENLIYSTVLLDTASAYATKKLLAELLYPKLEEVEKSCESWANREEISSQITSAKLQSAVSCLVVGALILPHLQDVNTRQSQELEDVVFRVLGNLLKALNASPESQQLVECLLRCISPHLPRMTNADLSHLARTQVYLHRLFSELSSFLRDQAADQSSKHVDDPMDLDEEFESQGSHSSTPDSKLTSTPRLESSIMSHPAAFYSDTTQRLHFLRAIFEDNGQVGLVPSTFLEDFLSLSGEELLSCRYLAKEIFDSDLVVNPDDAERVIERVGAVLSDPSLLSCEIALDLCLDLMEGFISMWADGGTELSAHVEQLYKHFLNKGLSNNLLSPNAQKSLARLLLRLVQVNEKFPETVNMPSPHTSLLRILDESRLPVKFYIGSRLPGMFGRYVLRLHEEMFLDVLEKLPTNEDFLEGIALRLYVLAEISRQWPTLLRRGVYHIFETPGSIPSSKQHATYCLKKIALSLELDDTRELFDLFASQLLYTWLHEGTVDDIPFEIFGFSSLEELLRRAQSEVVAIMEMRGQDDQVSAMAVRLGISEAELVQRTFSRTLAYSMAHDISIPKAEQHQSGESRIRKLLGREGFLDALYVNFADIIGIFISLIDQEHAVEKSWAKDENFTHAAETMASIKKCGHSDVVLGANQQPTFLPKYLAREIALLCSRTEYETTSLWNHALVVSIARRLFNSIHPALGPLHTCAVLRKVRVLVCLAGPHAWLSYPVEMLLHSIRPYIVDTECADDALGLSQFLLERGSEALSRSPSFLAGYALSTLASLRIFMETTQSSTTQESQFKATMSKAQRFHSWFTKYLDNYNSTLLRNDKQRNAFRVITQSAAHVRTSGNADRGSNESRLLLEILQDEADEVQLLNEPSRKLALGMLCQHFTVPSLSSNDVVRSDDEARALTKPIWRSCRAQDLSVEYLTWAGRVVGRGFAASGHIDKDLLRESDLSKYHPNSTEELRSEQGILNLVQSLTTDSDCFTAGLAESALRTIVSDAVSEEDNETLTACRKVLSGQLLEASEWRPYRTPPSDNIQLDEIREDYASSDDAFQDPRWAQNLSVHLIQALPENTILSALPPILLNVKGFAQEAFPYVLHLVLLFEHKLQQSARRKVSGAMKHWLKLDTSTARENIGLTMTAILYLRTEQLPGEHSIADRTQWLDLDLSMAASAAARCAMFKTALLLFELGASEVSRSSRRSSAIRAQESTDVLVDIFENIDDPDAYYGLSHTASLSNVLARLEYEKDGSKSLAFRGAQYDSHIRMGDPAAVVVDSHSLVGTLGNLGFSGLSHALLENQESLKSPSAGIEDTFDTARKLEIWNLPAPNATGNSSIAIYKAFQAWNQTTTLSLAKDVVHSGFGETMRNAVKHDTRPASLRQYLRSLAVLTELNDTMDVSSPAELDLLMASFTDHSSWMQSGRYEDVSHILSCRETTLSMLSRASQRNDPAKVKPPQARLAQVRSLLLSSRVHRYHQAFQESLNIATSLTDLVQPSADLGLSLESAAKLEAANSLWDYGEMVPSIRMLQSIDEETNLKKETLPLSRPDLLAKTAYQISVARLEKPDGIQKNYLQPALKELKGRVDGQEAGKVYHQFATFCDEQLQNPDSLEDLARLRHLRKGKSDEVLQLKGLVSGARDTQTRNRYQSHLGKAEQWLRLDEQELRRVEQSRSEFVRLSLENYLLSLAASDDHNNDALRFTAIWLERSVEESTNEAVKKHIEKVATRKFAPLMNQLSSRLLDQNSHFQKLLLDLVYRICVDHPYHGMYQIWSGTRSRPKKEDETALLRKQATEKVGKRLAHTEGSATVWAAIYNTSKAYHVLAMESGYKGGSKVSMRDTSAGSTLAGLLVKFRIPPPTMQLELSASKDYSQVPHVTKLEPTMTIASGVSAPKIVTLVASDGGRYKQLVKGGNDDLRQDAIMEQVFAAVSSVLKLHRSTRQRNLGIRTYKVLPLTQWSGLIEFVSNTIPLHDYLMPAHERYHPKDLKGSQCRKEIHGAQTKSLEARLATYKKVTDRFQPVMRYFFMEYFVDPDEWFAKRTAYTRTTAAISMLGHVLGLGDRHGHNILLDSASGEVVHIDLGVAFESGRVLPVPELVPFRLTRDIVDGMGAASRTEGVFRRCCEFTLDALREETYSIMTILDVLRYDPLYSWSISPVRVAKLQDLHRDDGGGGGGGGANTAATAEEGGRGAETGVSRRRHGATTVGGGGGAAAADGVANEPSEADRALEVVRKKLSKTLSVTATVNDLINQATDERNLAVLYSGWAAYA